MAQERDRKTSTQEKLKKFSEDFQRWVVNHPFRCFRLTAIGALTLCALTIIHHMLFAPHPFCDNFFYRVLPMFDCVYVLGGIVGMVAARLHGRFIKETNYVAEGKDLDRFSSRFEPRLAERTNHRDESPGEEFKVLRIQPSEVTTTYSYFFVTAIFTLICYSIKFVYDIKYLASTDKLSVYEKIPVQKEEFTDELINCTELKWQYHEHSSDIVFELLGISNQLLALYFAVKSKKLISLDKRKNRQKKKSKRINV